MAVLFSFYGKAVVIMLLLFSVMGQSLDGANATSSIPASGPGFYGAQQLMKVLGLGRQCEDDTRSTYLKQSIRAELKQRLSPRARIFLNGDEGFHLVNARYTDYRRPTFIAGVKVAEERDVIETVCNFLVTRSKHVAEFFR